MSKLSMFMIAGTAAAALAVAVPPPAQAASLSLTRAVGTADVSSHVIDAQWRGHRHHRHHGHWGGGRGALALGIGSAIIGGAIASQYAYGAPYYGYGYAPYAYGAPHAYGGAYAYGGGPYAYGGGTTTVYASDSGWEACRAQFRSLREDGTYTTFDGRQVMCPYLR